ncbi:MAG: MFS transporter [Proteobacteria bacterium]|nr:MFS transporter [Pseudomonadota bacterium]
MAGSQAFGGIGRALGNANYRIYWIGLCASMVGSWVFRTAVGWLTWELTKSPAWLGIIVAVEVIPSFFVAPPAGALVDRIGSLTTTKAVQLAWGIHVSVLSILTFSGLITIELLVGLAFLQGFINAFNNPGQLALVARLVPRSDISPAVALQSATVHGARFIGPPIAGGIIVLANESLAGPAWAFALNGVSFFMFFIMLFYVRIEEQRLPGSWRKGLFTDMVEGMRYVSGHFALRTILIFTVIMGLFLRSIVELFPGIVDNVFGRGAEGLALLLSAAGAGAFISAVWLARRGETRGLTQVFAWHFLIGGAATLAFALTTEFWLAAFFAMVFGFTTNTVSVAAQTLAQNSVDGRMRARVMSIVGLTFRPVPALGALLLGWLAEFLGFSWPIAVGAAVSLLAAIWLLLFMRRRDLATAAELAGDQSDTIQD